MSCRVAICDDNAKNAEFMQDNEAVLDPVVEAEIYLKFNDISGDKTAIYISPRLSSCKFCDEIAVFHNGTIIQKGTHEELLADENGKYHELWYAQAQYYAEKSELPLDIIETLAQNKVCKLNKEFFGAG